MSGQTCGRCGGPNPDPHLHERTGRPCFGPDFPWPKHLDGDGNPIKPPAPAPRIVEAPEPVDLPEYQSEPRSRAAVPYKAPRVKVIGKKRK